MMWDGGHMDGWGGAVGFVVMLAVLALIVVGVVLLVRGTSGRDPGSPPAAGRATTGALQILEERYAKGEIDRKEFLERKADLQG